MKITLINDLSGYGNCSLTANIPVLNVMGHETHPFPTAVLSNQTAYDSFFMRDCSADFAAYIAEWDKLGEKTDCVYAGFTPNAAVPEQAADLAEKYGAIFFFDPVLGDKGELYKCFDSSFIPRYRAAAACAQYITPNLTEACILGGEDFFSVCAEKSESVFLERVFALAETLCRAGTKNAVITGAPYGKKLFNVCLFGGKRALFSCRYFEKSYSGTGDLFDSVFLGALLNGEPPAQCVARAADFVSRCIAYSIEKNIDSRHGVDFTPFLKEL